MNILHIMMNAAKSYRVTPEEERETKYNRLVSSTLLSFGYVMELLQQNDIADVTEQFENIFGEKKFWKFSKHSSPMVILFSNFFGILLKCNVFWKIYS